MDLALSDEQSMLRDSAERWVRDWGAGGSNDQDTLWAKFAELGWLALPLAEDQGGLGGSILDTTLLLEAFGRGRLSTPYVETVIIGAGLIQSLGSEKQRDVILPAVANGEQKLTFAHFERGLRGGASSIDTAAVTDDGSLWLNGTKIAVIGADAASTLIVSARVSDDLGLFLVPRDAPGVSIASYSMTGGGDASTVTLKNVRLQSTDRLGSGNPSMAIDAVMDAAITVHCAEAVGMMSALLDATSKYAQTREQFGKPLAANQSVRFKLADMAVALEEARSLALRAALMLGASTSERIRAVAGAKAGIGRGARRVAELAIQLHGAMGVTEELTIGAYYKRVVAFDTLYGGIDHQLVRYARASGRLAQQVAA